ncbi:hypothetical protein [uncultured Gammaproteobacteria bacterium]|jgi:hypothetical protein|nr:hypothetical protein BROOK1789B_247 [Bathymodiolus brooksi thiotrophic gill symbiont]CAC9596051.1 hypothetical protein [uncultured Gammaproteobacteria bacterium]CAC9600996.1 hypothetical protein [uncultured Gammaproteobacteria bacterium]CAC9616674.1 hypothetical protein [uncultured Gammaproteobacteria bacterium]CAC9632990.1 hypothetical protein [uncultured Gammaproteobacteria bacterium]
MLCLSIDCRAFLTLWMKKSIHLALRKITKAQNKHPIGIAPDLQ